MRRKIVFIFLFFSGMICSGESSEYFLLDLKNNGTVNIELRNNIDNYSYAELLRSDKNDNYLPIYEFSAGVFNFKDNFIVDACYSLKIYFLDGTSVMTKPLCHERIDYLWMIDYHFLLIFLIFLFSFVFSCFSVPSIFAGHSRDALRISETIKSLLGEETRDIIFCQPEYSFGNPLKNALVPMALHFSALYDMERHVKIDVPFFEQYTIRRADNVRITDSGFAIPYIPLYPLFKNIKKKDPPVSLLSFSSGSIESDFLYYQKREHESIINVSSTVSGSVANIFTGKSGVLSVESFVLPSDIESEENKKKHSFGAYLFLMIITVIIFAGSIIYTIDSVFPVLKYFRFFIGDGK